MCMCCDQHYKNKTEYKISVSIVLSEYILFYRTWISHVRTCVFGHDVKYSFYTGSWYKEWKSLLLCIQGAGWEVFSYLLLQGPPEYLFSRLMFPLQPFFSQSRYLVAALLVGLRPPSDAVLPPLKSPRGDDEGEGGDLLSPLFIFMVLALIYFQLDINLYWVSVKCWGNNERNNLNLPVQFYFFWSPREEHPRI